MPANGSLRFFLRDTHRILVGTCKVAVHTSARSYVCVCVPMMNYIDQLSGKQVLPTSPLPPPPPSPSRKPSWARDHFVHMLKIIILYFFHQFCMHVFLPSMPCCGWCADYYVHCMPSIITNTGKNNNTIAKCISMLWFRYCGCGGECQNNGYVFCVSNEWICAFRMWCSLVVFHSQRMSVQYVTTGETNGWIVFPSLMYVENFCLFKLTIRVGYYLHWIRIVIRD